MLIFTLRTLFHREAISGASPIQQLFKQAVLFTEADSAYRKGRQTSMEEAVFKMSLNRICSEFSFVAKQAQKQLYARTKSGAYEIDRYEFSTELSANLFFYDSRHFHRNGSNDRRKEDPHLVVEDGSRINVKALIDNHSGCKKVVDKAASMKMAARISTTLSPERDRFSVSLISRLKLELVRQ